jgi:hypothetical protein
LEVIRHKSDYDDFYIASKSETEEKVMTAGNLIKLVEDYLNMNKEVSE